jgi:hypothetical protein
LVSKPKRLKVTELFQGFAKFYKTGPAANPLVVLATGASVNLVLEPIPSSAVWGAGWYNAASSAHYADNAIHYEGTIDFELQGGDDIWNLLGDWIVNERAYPRSLDISPDGARVYQYRTTGVYDANYDLNGAWNTNASFNTSEGSFVTVSTGVIALNRSEVDPAGGNTYTDYSYIKQKTGIIGSDVAVFNATNPLNPGGSNVNPIPYWRTNAQLLTGTYANPFSGGAAPQTGLETVEWSVDASQNQIILYTCNGSRLPTALLQGAMDVSGNVVLYHEVGVFDPILGPAGTGDILTPYLYAENTWFRVEIKRGDSTPSVFLELPAVIVESDDYSLTDANSVTNRTFSLKGMGGRTTTTHLLPPFLMSDATGAYVAP